MTCCRSEKGDKRIANRKLRRKVKLEVDLSDNYTNLDKRDVSDVWTFNKDGKVRSDDETMRRK
jgi:hypothetical protein